MSEADETKKRSREEDDNNEKSEDNPSSEPPNKQSKIIEQEETPAEEETAIQETPTQSTTNTNINEDPSSKVELQNEQYEPRPSEEGAGDNNFSATKDEVPLAEDKTPISQDVSSETQEAVDIVIDREGGVGPTVSETMPPTETTDAAPAPVTGQDSSLSSEQQQPEASTERPGDPVAATADKVASVEGTDTSPNQEQVVAPSPQEMGAGVVTAPSISDFTPKPEIQTSPDKLAPPPEAHAATGGAFDPNQVIEEKGEISAEIAGRVIGKGGEVIRDLQARSGASIDVDAAPHGNHRIVTYRGPRRKVEFAKQLVGMISRGINDSDLPLGEAIREILLIPASATGKVIGRGGEMVREMQTRSQAKIDFDHAATANRPDQKQVVVTGTPDAVRKANEMIMFLVANPQLEAMQALNLLVNEKLASGTPWGSGPPYPNLPNAGTNMQPEMLGSYGSPGGYGPDAQYATLPPSQSSYGGRPPPVDNRFGGGGAASGMTEDIFFAKKQFMGRIIGQKGITINDLQKRSGADIQINQDVMPGQECEIRIRGTRDGVEMVKQMLRQIIEIGPGHPFAGGAGGGGHGGGGAYGGTYGGAPYQAAGGGGYDYASQSYGGYPPQQQGAYGYPPQGGAAASSGYGGPPQSAYQSYGASGSGYPGQSFGGAPAYGGAPQTPYGGYQSHSSGYPQSYGQSGGAYQQHSSAPQSYGAGAYGQSGPPGYPPAPVPPPAPAASGWKAASSPDGQTYYYNETTGATQWEKPPGFA